MIGVPRVTSRNRAGGLRLPARSTYLMTVLIILFGMYVLVPVLLIFVNSFDVAGVGEPRTWSLENWRIAFSSPDIFTALGNTFMIFGMMSLTAARHLSGLGSIRFLSSDESTRKMPMTKIPPLPFPA